MRPGSRRRERPARARAARATRRGCRSTARETEWAGPYVFFLCSRGPTPARSRWPPCFAGLPSGASLGPQALLVENAQEGRPWDAIVGTLPFAFDFDAVLRRGMTEPEIDSRKRALADFGQHVHVNARLFVGRCVGRRIRVAACQAVDGTLGGIHRHVQLAALHAIGHERAHTHLTIARDQPDPRPALKTALLR